MSLSKDNTHVFIVRIWWEPREIEGAIPKWRGMIEHVPGDKRRYLEDLDEIIDWALQFASQAQPAHIVLMSNSSFGGIPADLVNRLRITQ